MNTEKLRAHEIEAHAWATLTGPGKPSDRTAPRSSRGLRRLDIIEAGAVLGFTAAIAFLGLSAAGLLPYASAHSQERAELPIASTGTAAMPARPTMMDIVPANVIDPNPSFFIGTGDGSAGAWTRP